MIRHIPAARRHFNDFGWLKTFWLFSFSEYYDPENIQFGALRVFNDDVVAPGTGFPTHPHREMEIVTIVLSGEITHADSMGNSAVIRQGEVQRMSAGTGLTHSEFNLGQEPVHFFQLWFLPDEHRVAPSYEQRAFEPGSWRNRLVPVASGQGAHDAVTFNTDATVYRASLDQGNALEFRCNDTRRIFIYLIDGALEVNGLSLEKGDQARLDEEVLVAMKALKTCTFVLVDSPSCKGFGYDVTMLRAAQTR